MFCRHCGNEIDEKSAFCPACGKKVTSSKKEMDNNIIPKVILCLVVIAIGYGVIGGDLIMITLGSVIGLLLSIYKNPKKEKEANLSRHKETTKYHNDNTTNISEESLFTEAGFLIIENNKVSIGMLQRIYKIDYSVASSIMNQLCEAGVISNDEGEKRVLMTKQQFEEYLRVNNF